MSGTWTKRISLLWALVLTLALFAGCGTQNDQSRGDGESAVEPETTETSDLPEDDPENREDDTQKTTIAIGALKGPTGMGMAPLMHWTEQGEAAGDYVFTLDSAPDIIQGKLVSGELDIAALPTNVASVLYDRTGGGVKLLAINTLGVLHIVQGPGVDIGSIADLEGMTIYSAGQGSTQEYVINHLLERSGLSDSVSVEFRSEHAEVAALLLTGECQVALLPEPFVTNVTTRDESVSRALDITQEWEKAAEGVPLVMGCLVIRSEFLEENEAAVNAFLAEYRASTEFVNSRVDEAAEMIGDLDIVDAAVARLAIPGCNIVCLTGEEMQASAQSYLEAIAEQNITAVGGSLPDEGFYYLP